MNNILIKIFVMALLLMSGRITIGAPSVIINTYPNEVEQYAKYEVALSVSTIASNPFWPYDPTPDANMDSHPNAVQARVGVSVDGLFLPPSETDWSKAVIQPGFYYQDYTDRDNVGNRHGDDYTRLIPVGYPTWRIRFAPTAIGKWRFKIRVVDAGGTAESEEKAFTCIQGLSHGFIKCSDRDSRYFVLSDGTYVPLIGIENPAKTVQDFENIYPKLADMGVNFLRCWWQSSNPRLSLFGAGGQGGDLTWHNLNYSTDYVRLEHLTSSKQTINGGSGQLWCTAMVKPSTSYQCTAWVKTVNFTGTEDWGVI